MIAAEKLGTAAKGFATHGPDAKFEPFSFTRREVGPHDILIDIAFCGICHSDIHQARAELVSRGVECSEVQVIDPRDGGTFFGFADPDGNTWAVQQIRARADRPLIPVEHRGRFGEGVEP